MALWHVGKGVNQRIISQGPCSQEEHDSVLGRSHDMGSSPNAIGLGWDRFWRADKAGSLHADMRL